MRRLSFFFIGFPHLPAESAPKPGRSMYWDGPTIFASSALVIFGIMTTNCLAESVGYPVNMDSAAAMLE